MAIRFNKVKVTGDLAIVVSVQYCDWEANWSGFNRWKKFDDVQEERIAKKISLGREGDIENNQTG